MFRGVRFQAANNGLSVCAADGVSLPRYGMETVERRFTSALSTSTKTAAPLPPLYLDPDVTNGNYFWVRIILG